jgi:guanylate kinase
MTRPYVLLNISGPYGVGKDTLLNYILQWQAAKVGRVSTVTTRPSTPESDPSYRTVSREEFESITARGGWIITRQLGGKVLYGTSLDEIDNAGGGQLMLHSVYPSAEGSGALRSAYGRQLLSIGVLASEGDLDSQISLLRKRLLSRGRDDSDVISARLAHQADAIRYIVDNPVVDTADGPMHVFDIILINDDLGRSKSAIRDLWLERIEPSL